MLKEGWDVTNLYTIIPLRAANARTLVEQSIGRGLRLPYGQRTGVLEVDRLNIVAHDKFQEIVDDARRADSPIRLQTLVLDPEAVRKPLATVVSRPNYAPPDPQEPSYAREGAAVYTPAERAVADIVVQELHRMSANRAMAPTSAALSAAAVQAQVVQAVQSRMTTQLALPGVEVGPDVMAIVAQVTQSLVNGMIDIPRIVVTPKGRVLAGFRPFTLDLAGVRPSSAADTLWVQNLNDGVGNQVVLSAEQTGGEEVRLEDYLVRHLIDFKDVDYMTHADLLYDLAGQTVRHLKTYLPDDEVEPVLRQQGEALSRLIHGQMQAHYEEGADEGYEATVHRGWTELKPCAYTIAAGESPRDFRQAPPDLGRIGTYLFGGFRKCLYPVQKFDSNPERILSVILDRDVDRWFRPNTGQFQIRYRRGSDHPEYVPDFVAETASALVMLEVKASNQLTDAEVKAKAEAAREWASHATKYSSQNGGKPWVYVMLAHDTLQENMSFDGLTQAAFKALAEPDGTIQTNYRA
jgi:type III restriction enzyme